MKKCLFLTVALLAISFWSCKDKNDGPVVTYTAEFQLIFPEDNEIAKNAEYSVTISNAATKFEATEVVDETGKVVFTGLVAGIYTVSAKAEAIDNHTGFTYICSGSLNSLEILSDEQTFEINISVVDGGKFIFKEMYWVGSKTPESKTYFRDQFYEIYNNSTQTIYADGLCIGHLLPEQATGVAVYDWQIDNPKDYVFLHTVLQIPGTPGVTQNYPVEPGESIILCQWAINHQIATLNPNSPVNLSGAEFEYYNPNNSVMTDEPAVNMNMVFRSNTSALQQWLVTVFGAAYAIFYPDKELKNEDRLTNATIGKIGESETLALAVHVDNVLDAVETMRNESQKINKRVPDVLDQGSVWIIPDDPESSDPSYSGYGITRKIKETKEDGTIVLQDTNNSSNDFEQVVPQVRRHGTKVPSWNTWANN